MRKRQQKQIFELIETLRDAQSAGLYGDAQEGALAVGAFIEQIEGEGNPRIAGTIALLEEYCELLFGASKGEVGGKALRKHLIKLENGVREELAPDRIEVLFVSYNASMSDSILSIYTAAKADSACDAVWLPVPYFEKTGDGAFGAMRYEGAECYGGTDCADWREYDIEARRPDAIFTFNPYDASNTVTSVHPDFYCERLRGLTDLLVYVPYFVAVNDVSEHFCTVAGCVYAHKVIVQSEEIRDTYIRAFKEAYGNRLGRPEDKFVALGSPKFDAVLSAKREDFELPDAWRGLMGGRKVVFYNTSVGAILARGARYLEKLRHVLDVFRERDDVLLWWRPHPLSEATYDSMRPELADEYGRIVAGYRREGFGIYDDTADLYRAIAWTDAYYGDASSVVQLYERTGKPVMIQNIAVVPSNDLADGLWMLNLWADERYIWFHVWNFNAVFRLDRQSADIKCITQLPGNLIYSGYPYYGSVIGYKSKLYFPPASAVDDILEYDINLDKITKIPIQIQKSDDVNSWRFGTSFSYKHYLFLLPANYPAIIKFDTVTSEIRYITDCIAKLDSVCGGIKGVYVSGFCKVGNKLVFTTPDIPVLTFLDMDNCTSEIITLPGVKHGYNDVAFDGASYWLAPKDSCEVLKVTINGNSPETEYLDTGAKYTAEGKCYVSADYLNGHIYLVPFYADRVVRIDPQTSEISIVNELQTECNKPELEFPFLPYVNFSVSRTAGDVLCCFSLKSNALITYDTVTGERRELRLRLNDSETEILHNRIIADRLKGGTDSQNHFHDENFFYNANVLADIVTGANESKLRGEFHDGNSGQRIYDFIKNSLS